MHPLQFIAFTQGRRWLQLSFLILSLSIVSGILPAQAGTRKPDQARLEQLDAYAFKADNRHTSSIQTLAAYLSKGATTDYEKARVLFAWIAANIRYDDYGFNTGKSLDSSPAYVLKTRKAICDGYARLFQALGQEMGLKVEKVSGYAKGYGYAPGKRFARTNHAWNAVRIDDSWILADPTWAAGSAKTVNGKLKTVYKYDPYWFDTDPHVFLFSHLPVNPDFQFIAKPVSLGQYEQLPRVEVSLFRLGIGGAEILENMLKGKLKNLPATWKTDFEIRNADIPLQASLLAGKSQTFSFNITEDVELIVKNGKDWHYFTTKGTTHTLQLKPVAGDLAIMARPKGSKANYSYFLEYKVGR
ncbi:hypothetical protein H7F15_06530 [Pontibacter sp. Tf4]|uniref:transglutaminase domain-containing protein n=1 Tax=Pontibacter sp. Tf4 TaxID=2761620 RepID=UPI00162AD642|nr:transglutaminase domain-containing protein [Pontibacter sp. Tf4]MBB6610686.1 hypothetical protein [Pontibacter sp. Tf4]